MMILVFDTSSSHLAIGLADESGTLLREFHAEAMPEERGIHDARFASETAKLLKEVGIIAKQISRIGLIIGPGSFTGLRIGLSFAKGLAFATGAAIVPLTQHEVIAAEGTKGLIVTAGYRDDLFYVAEADSPRDIRLVNRDALPNSSFLIPHSSLSSLSRLTASATAPVTGEALDALEPLYITEFKITEKG